MAVVLLLRGMNVGGRRLTNDDLISVFERSGYENVSAFQASGNVVLGSTDSVEEVRLAEILTAALGYHVDVFVRSPDEIRRIATESPLRGRVGDQGGKPQVVFLHPHDSYEHEASFPDDHEVHRIGSELHWLPPAGLSEIGPMKLTGTGKPGPTTVRTLGTIERLAKRLP